MRNALVLVPLCIGLTSGFIVPTSTSETNNLQNMVTLKYETVVIHDNETKNDSMDSIDLGLQLYDIKEDDIKQEMYNESSEDKNVHERSFIFVNHGWSRKPSESNSVDTLVENASRFKVFSEDKRKTVVAGLDNMRKTFLNDIKEQFIEYNKYRTKSYSTHETERKFHSNHVTHSKQNIERKRPDKLNYLTEFLKSAIIEPAVKITNKQSNYKTMEHLVKVNNENQNDAANKHNAQKVSEKNRERYDNAHIFNNDINEVKYDSNNILTENRLIHLLLEEQGPQKLPTHTHNNKDIGRFKYCQNCAQLAKLSNLNQSPFRAGCECKCGRYIHLKGQSRPNDLIKSLT